MCKEVSLSNYLDLYRKCIDHSRSCTKNSPRFDPNFHLYIYRVSQQVPDRTLAKKGKNRESLLTFQFYTADHPSI